MTGRLTLLLTSLFLFGCTSDFGFRGVTGNPSQAQQALQQPLEEPPPSQECAPPIFGVNIKTFENPGTHSFTVPPCVTAIQVELWGGGGGGCAGMGGAGGAGGYSQCTLAVTPGQTFKVNVGAAGIRGAGSWPACSTATGGGSSEFIDLDDRKYNCVATGGGPGAGGGGSGGNGMTVSKPGVLGIINLVGGQGSDLMGCNGFILQAAGGASPRGGNGSGVNHPVQTTLSPGTAPGGGGPAVCYMGIPAYDAAGDGAAGAVHVRW